MILLHVGVGVWTNSLWFFVLAAISVALLTWGVILREERYQVTGAPVDLA